jgi:hypothetical protein
MKPKQSAHLDKWSTIQLGDGHVRYLGIVTGHPTLPEGEEIFTSPVVDVREEDGIKIVETRNTVYTLGEPSSESFDKIAGLAAN